MNQKVTKNDLVDAIYQKTNFDKQDVLKTVDALLDQIKVSIEQGSTIELRGFGTFEPRLRKGRKAARNPKTGDKVSVAPHYVAIFRAGQSLKNNLKNLKIKDEK